MNPETETEIIKLEGEKYSIEIYYNKEKDITEKLIIKGSNKKVEYEYVILDNINKKLPDFMGYSIIIVKGNNDTEVKVELWDLRDGHPEFVYIREYIEDLRKGRCPILLIPIDVTKPIADSIAEYFLLK